MHDWVFRSVHKRQEWEGDRKCKVEIYSSVHDECLIYKTKSSAQPQHCPNVQLMSTPHDSCSILSRLCQHHLTSLHRLVPLHCLPWGTAFCIAHDSMWDLYERAGVRFVWCLWRCHSVRGRWGGCVKIFGAPTPLGGRCMASSQLMDIAWSGIPGLIRHLLHWCKWLGQCQQGLPYTRLGR